MTDPKPHTPEPENAEDRIAQAKAKAMSDKCGIPEDDDAFNAVPGRG